MQLVRSSWPEVEIYLKSSTAIVVPVGATEQHGPMGLIGTDAICPELIARLAGDEAGFLVGPTFNVGMSQHHMNFPGSISLRPSTMIAALCDWANSLAHHGFTRIYWLNGHGGNAASLNAAFAEIYNGAGGAGGPVPHCMMRNWWELDGVGDVSRTLFPVGDGVHATPSEISVAQFAHPEAIKVAELSPRIAPVGPIHDAEDFRRRFPDGRIGSDSSLASVAAGEKIVTVAVRSLIAEFNQFAAS